MYTNRSGQFAGESVTARWRAFTAERVLEGAYRLTEIPGIPHYQKLVRYQDQITFYESTDGIDWKWVEGTTLAGLATNLNVGLAVWSRDGSLVDGTFDNVSLNALTLPYTTSCVGNSLPGGGSHVPQDVLAMYVDPTNGNLYTNTIWDEGGAEVSVFDTNGKYVRSMDETHNHGGGHAVTSNGSYVYAAMTLQPYYVVRRYNLNGTPAPWSGGGGPDGSMLIVPDVLNPTTDHLRGLAINRRTGGAYTNRLYVSDPAAGMVRIYQENTDNTIHWITSFPLARPRAIAINPVDDAVWVIQADDPSLSGNQSAVLHFTATGGALPHDTIPPKKGSTINFGVPTALTVRSDGKVWVADDGPNQQIRIFSSTGILSSTFGDAGGIYSIAGMSKKGEVRPTKFNGPTGIGLDNNGNICVACDGVEVQGGGTAGSVEGGTGTELRKFDAATHNLLWEKYGLAFVDTTDVDPATDGLDLFDRQRHYEMDYSQPAGQQWKYKGLTLDRFSYPNDGRLHQLETSLGPAIVRRLPPGDNAKRILFLTTQYGGFLAIYRFDPNSEIAIPSGLLMSANPGGVWPPNRLPGTGQSGGILEAATR